MTTWYSLSCRSYTFVHYTISLSPMCKLIWRHWSYNTPVRYIFFSVSDNPYPLSYPLCNMWGFVFSVYPFMLWWLRIYILFLIIIIIKPELWTNIHCLMLGQETMACTVCLYTYEFLYGRIASRDIRVLVVFAPNLTLLSLTCCITTMLGTLLMIAT